MKRAAVGLLAITLLMGCTHHARVELVLLLPTEVVPTVTPDSIYLSLAVVRILYKAATSSNTEFIPVKPFGGVLLKSMVAITDETGPLDTHGRVSAPASSGRGVLFSQEALVSAFLIAASSRSPVSSPMCTPEIVPSGEMKIVVG